jgi:ribosomal-protein-alanine N-acetyltransferase
LLRAGIPRLETERLVLSPLSIAHSQGMFELWSKAEVCEFSGSAVDAHGLDIPLPVASRRDSDRLLEYWLDRARSGSGFRWAVTQRADDSFVGAVGFNSLGHAAELAYHLVPRHWGRGFAREASRAAVEWVFTLGTTSVTCKIEPANRRSTMLAQALGFAPTPGLEDGVQTHRLAGSAPRA